MQDVILAEQNSISKESKVLFQQLLNLSGGWKVSEVNFVQPRGFRPQVHIRLAYDTDQGVDVATGGIMPCA